MKLGTRRPGWAFLNVARGHIIVNEGHFPNFALFRRPIWMIYMAFFRWPFGNRPAVHFCHCWKKHDPRHKPSSEAS